MNTFRSDLVLILILKKNFFVFYDWLFKRSNILDKNTVVCVSNKDPTMKSRIS